MRYLLTGLAYVVSLVVTAAVVLVAVLFLAGPHAGLLPQPLEVVVIIAGWGAVVALPIVAARGVWKRVGARGVA